MASRRTSTFTTLATTEGARYAKLLRAEGIAVFLNNEYFIMGDFRALDGTLGDLGGAGERSRPGTFESLAIGAVFKLRIITLCLVLVSIVVVA